MTPSAIRAASPVGLLIPEQPWANLRSWLRRGRGRPSGYHESPPADVYGAILERDATIQPETLTRMYW